MKNLAKSSFFKAEELSNLNSDLKYNWAKQIRSTFFERIDAANLWDDLSLETLSKEKKNLTEKFISYSKGEDLRKCLESSSLSLYPALCETPSGTVYLQGNAPLEYKRIIAQVRLVNIYNPRILLKKGKSILIPNDYCELCAKANSLEHKVFECLYFTEVRDKYLTNVIENANSFPDLLNTLKPFDLKKLSGFLATIL